MQKRFLLIVSLVLASIALTSCKSTGAGVAAPGAATLSVSFSLKELMFTWTGASGSVDHYVLAQSPDGVAAFTQVGGNIASTTTSLNLTIADHLLNWPSTKYEIQACNAGGCTNSNQLGIASGVLQAIGYFKASNTAANYFFGEAVSVSGDGNTIAVGSDGEGSSTTGINSTPNSSAPGAGAVYVFIKTGTNTWTQQAYIKASNTQANYFFGYPVALSSDGNTLAAGSIGEASNATGINGTQSDTSESFAGAVYVFSRSGTTWTQQAYIKASNTAAFSDFAYSLAISSDGNTLAAGADGESSSSTGINSTPNSLASSAGAAYVFTRTGTTWSQQAYVKASNTKANARFYLVALSGDSNTLAVGARFESSDATGINGNQADTSAPGAGAVYVFTRSGTVWAQQAYVKASNSASSREFATPALNTNGTTLAVGANGELSDATGINGNQTDISDPQAGAVYVFTLSGTWSQQAYIKASNTRARALFGIAVALSGDGNTMAVGSSQESSDATGINGNQADTSDAGDGVNTFGAGAVYTFTRSGTTWTQAAYVKPTNTAASDQFGLYLSLSSDGQTLAVGATGDNSNATGIDGNASNSLDPFSGAAYIY